MEKIYLILVILILAAGCKKPYNPQVITAPNGYLVVEGTINTGSDSTIFKLSRTGNISAGTTIIPETGATVAVQSDGNTSYPLKELTKGYYAAVGLNLDNTKKYRLSIKTANNQQYASDFVAVTNTPPIDSVGYIVQTNGIQLYVSTHDPNNNTHYYRWDYVETWQFHADFDSQWISNGKQIVARTAAQMVYSCFGNHASSTIVLGSSVKLSQDVINQNPLTTVADTDEKLETKYSILVRQYGLTGDAFTFWTDLKANTEQLGSIFDPQPFTNSGNIHNVNNASEPVIGYVSACLVQTKRIYILKAQLPQSFTTIYPYECEEGDYYFIHFGQHQVLNNLVPLNSTVIPVSSFGVSSPEGATDSSSSGFLGAYIQCVDCTLRGTTQQPGFWK
jgi:hypothetical protein